MWFFSVTCHIWQKMKNKTYFQLVLNPFLSGDAAKRPNIQFPVTDPSIKHEDIYMQNS